MDLAGMEPSLADALLKPYTCHIQMVNTPQPAAAYDAQVEGDGLNPKRTRSSFRNAMKL